MDISALSLAFGAQTEQTGQTPVAPGFDLTLEQAAVGGFVPPGAPPGPEPPPDILIAGEGVEVLEPNAQPQKLDLLPQEQTDLDIELPEPFWEKPVEEEASADRPPVDEAMEWLAGQMTGGFFVTPLPATSTSSFEFTPVDSPQSDCIYRVSGTQPEPGCDLPVMDLGKVAWTQPDPIAAVNAGPVVSEVPASPGQAQTVAPLTPTAPIVDPKIAEALNVTSIEVEAPEAVKTPLQDNTLKVTEASPDTVETQTVTAPVIANEPAVETKDPLSTRPPVEDKPVAASEAPKKDAKAKVEVGATPVQPEKPVAKAVNESTALEVAEEKARPGQTDNEHSKREFGHSHKKDKSPDTAVVEMPAPGRIDKPSLLNHSRPDSVIEANAVRPATGVTKTDNEALTPKEVDLVLKQVVDKLHMLAAARPKNGVTIHLNPEDLGSITVVVKSIGRMVDTQLSASDHRVRQALDQNQTRLVEAMDARGFQVQNVAVSAQTNNATQNESTRNWQQPNQQQSQSNNQSGQSHGHRGQSDRHFEQPKSNIRAWVRRGEGVDLSI